MKLNNVDRVVPILGVSNPSTTGDEIAGTYNFMDLQCNSKSYGVYSGCTTYKGTVKVVSTGTSSATYSTCTGGNLVLNSPVCSITTSGIMTHLGGGVWLFKSGASTYSTNYLVAFTAPNGQKVGFIDFNDPTVYGFGMGAISTTTAMVPTDIAGTYFYLNNYGQAGAVVVNADGTTSTGSTVSFNGVWEVSPLLPVAALPAME